MWGEAGRALMRLEITAIWKQTCDGSRRPEMSIAGLEDDVSFSSPDS
jgi:hypothetical protein